MKTRKFIATLIVCITLLMSMVCFSNTSYAELSKNKEYIVPQTPFEHNAKFLIDLYANGATADNPTIAKYLYDVNEEMINNKEAIFEPYFAGLSTGNPQLSSYMTTQLTHISKGDDRSERIKELFSKKLSCKKDEVTIEAIYSSPAIPELKIDALDAITVTSDMEQKDTVELVEKIANHEIAVFNALGETKEAEDINNGLKQMRGEMEEGMLSYKERPLALLGYCHHLVTEIRVKVKDVDTYSFVLSKGDDENPYDYYYVYRADLKPAFDTSLDYESVEGTEVKKKATSAEENPFLPYYTDNDNNKKDTDAIVYIRSKTDEKIVSVDGVELKSDGSANEKGWYYPDASNQKVVAKKYLFDTYNNKNDNGKVNEKVEVVGENDGKSQENPNIEWTFRRKIKEETTKDDGSKVITITFNLPIDESKVEEGWSVIRDDDGAVRKITRAFKKNEGYDKEVVVYQNGTGKEVKTPVKLTAPVISKTGETTLFTIAFIALAGAAVVVLRKKIK